MTEIDTTPISQLCAKNTRIEELEAALKLYACGCLPGTISNCRRFDREDCGWAAKRAIMTEQEREADDAIEKEYEELNGL